MEGFFNIEEIAISRGDEKLKRQIKKKKCYCGIDCTLDKKCISSKISLSGEGRKQILIIGKAPSKNDDKNNLVFSGEDGDLIRETLDELELDLKKDFWYTNALRCRPPKGRQPTPAEVQSCRKYLDKIIEEKNPIGIILLGGTAIESLIGHRISGRIKNVKYSDYFGELIPDQELKKWVCPVYHPFDVLKDYKNKALLRLFKRQLKIAVRTCKNRFYVHNYNKDVFTTMNEKEAIGWVNTVRKNNKERWVAYDYETTGLKPHREGHKIYSVSISDGMFAWSFPFFDSLEFRKAWNRFLKDPKVWKVAHHAGMETQWSKNISGVYPRGKLWDTAIGSRTCNNKKAAQLKFNVYTKFGVIGYDEEVDYFLKTLNPSESLVMKKSGNRFNMIESAPKEKTIEYGGLDSLYTHKLRDYQDSKVGAARAGLLFFNESVQWLTRASDNGIRVNVEKMKAADEKIEKKLKRLNKSILKHSSSLKWDGNKIFNFNSDKQLGHLLFDILDIKSNHKTASGAKSVDKDALEKIKSKEYGDYIKKILDYKRWYKAKNTYIAQYKREMVNGLLHPFYNLDVTDTFRSSSDSPNFQNVPKHDKIIMKILRGFIIPRLGNRLIEYDYKGAEVTTAACVTGDPVLLANVTDFTKDMHRDEAANLFLKDASDITKLERQIAKNKYVFRTFYGGYFKQSAPELWNEINEETKQHIMNQGIRNLKDFTGHVEDCENKFWNETFRGYRDWKEWIWKSYNKKGYVDLKTGFRCYAPMSKNQVTNYVIQGPAFHILLWSLCRLMEYLDIEHERFQDTFILGQIHDATVGDVSEENEREIDQLVWKFGTQEVREHWDWITVPLHIEKERSEINGSWAEMLECGFLKGE